MKEELRAIGLTEGETTVYLSLLKLGPSTNSPIAKHSGLQSSTVYYCLNSLIEKGFVSYVQKGGRRYFIASNPQNILAFLEEKEDELAIHRQKIAKILPELKSAYQSIQEKTFAEVYEGWNGFRMIFDNIRDSLKRGERYEAFALGQELGEPEQLRLTFMRHNKMLKAKGIKLRLLAHNGMRLALEKMYGKLFLTTYQEIRYTEEKIPVGVTIYKNNVITHIIDKGKPISFLIHNRKHAEIYHNFFNEAWNRAKP